MCVLAICVCVSCSVIYATFATFVISLALFFRIFPTFSSCFFFLERMFRRWKGAGEVAVLERGRLFVCFVLLTLLISPNARSIHLLCASGLAHTSHGPWATGLAPRKFAAVMCTLIDTWSPSHSPPSAAQGNTHLWAWRM